MFRPMRQRRYNKLIKSGFLPFEAVGLSKMPISSMPPYILQMIKDRSNAARQAMEQEKSKTQFTKELKQEYINKNWAKKTKSGNISPLSVYNGLRDYEDAYRNKYPNYVSPWEKRQKQFNIGIKKATKNIRKWQKQYLGVLKAELKKAQEHKNQNQIDIITHQIKNIEGWV